MSQPDASQDLAWRGQTVWLFREERYQVAGPVANRRHALRNNLARKQFVSAFTRRRVKHTHDALFIWPLEHRNAPSGAASFVTGQHRQQAAFVFFAEVGRNPAGLQLL